MSKSALKANCRCVAKIDNKNDEVTIMAIEDAGNI